MRDEDPSSSVADKSGKINSQGSRPMSSDKINTVRADGTGISNRLINSTYKVDGAALSTSLDPFSYRD